MYKENKRKNEIHTDRKKICRLMRENDKRGKGKRQEEASDRKRVTYS